MPLPHTMSLLPTMPLPHILVPFLIALLLHPTPHLPQPTMNPNLTMPLNLTMHPHLIMPLNLTMHLNLMLLHLQNLHTTNPNLTMPLTPHLAMELLNPVMDPLNPVMGPHPNVLGANQISPMVQITPTRPNMYPTILPPAMEPLIP